jgi:hypothetical protein
VCTVVVLAVSPIGDRAEAQMVHPEIWLQPTSALPADPELEYAVDELLARLTVEEKVGKVLQVERGQVTPADMRDDHLGSVLSGGGSHPSTGSEPGDWFALASATRVTPLPGGRSEGDRPGPGRQLRFTTVFEDAAEYGLA